MSGQICWDACSPQVSMNVHGLTVTTFPDSSDTRRAVCFSGTMKRAPSSTQQRIIRVHCHGLPANGSVNSLQTLIDTPSGSDIQESSLAILIPTNSACSRPNPPLASSRWGLGPQLSHPLFMTLARRVNQRATQQRATQIDVPRNASIRYRRGQKATAWTRISGGQVRGFWPGPHSPVSVRISASLRGHPSIYFRTGEPRQLGCRVG